MPKYYNSITKQIVEYPEDAAALFDVLKPIPSEKQDKDSDDQIKIIDENHKAKSADNRKSVEITVEPTKEKGNN